MIDLEKMPEKDVIFHFNTYFWIDKKGYLRLEGDGYLELYGKRVANFKFKDMEETFAIKVYGAKREDKKFKGIKKIIRKFNEKNEVEFLSSELDLLVSRSPIEYRTTLEEAYIG